MVYFFTDGENIKIGYTSQNIKSRLKQLQTGSSKKILSLGWIEGDKKTEGLLHKKFQKYRTFSDGEWFFPDDSLISYINSNNLKENTYVDIVNGKVTSFLSISVNKKL